TPVGHSRRHALHETHKSSASYSSCEVSPSGPSCPVSASRSPFARPRVTWCSSSVTRYDGHIAPDSLLRHAPLLLHISTAPVKPPHSDQSSWVSSGIGAYCGP